MIKVIQQALGQAESTGYVRLTNTTPRRDHQRTSCQNQLLFNNIFLIIRPFLPHPSDESSFDGIARGNEVDDWVDIHVYRPGDVDVEIFCCRCIPAEIVQPIRDVRSFIRPICNHLVC